MIQPEVQSNSLFRKGIVFVLLYHWNSDHQNSSVTDGQRVCVMKCLTVYSSVL